MKINEDMVPSTFLEAVTEFHNSLDNMEKVKVTEDNWYTDHHFSTGTYLRNNWSLWDNQTPLVQDCIRLFNLFGHGDDISGLISVGVTALANGLDPVVEANKAADRYRKHWKSLGVDPVTGKLNGTATGSITYLKMIVDKTTGNYIIEPNE